MKERHPRLVRQGWRFLLFTVSPYANPTVLWGSCQLMTGVHLTPAFMANMSPKQFVAYPAKQRYL